MDHFDPAQMYSTVSWFLARGVYRTLTTYPNGSGGLVGDLATDTGHRNDDATEWTYSLRTGIKFGPAQGGRVVRGVTGREITCDDLRYGIERIFMASVGAGYPFYYDMIEGADDFASGATQDLAGVECPSDDSIVFHLTEPAPDWPFRLTMPATSPVPRSYAERYDEGPRSTYDSHVVFTGPYAVTAHDPGRSMHLERNPQWDPATDPARSAHVGQVDWTMALPNDPGIADVVRDRYDLSLDFSARGPLLEKIVTNPRLLPRFVNAPTGCTRYIFLNTRIEPFDDPLVRRAVNVAIDRANLKRIYGGPVTGPVAMSVVPPGMPGYLPPSRYSPFDTPALAGDIKRAKRMMARAGYQHGYDRPIRIVGAADPPLSRIFESVVGDLRRLGFSHLVTLQPPASEEHDKYYARPESETSVGTSAGWCKDYPQPYSFLVPVLATNPGTVANHTNYAQLDDPELQAALDRASQEVDPAAALPLWQEADRIATESGAWIPWSWDESSILLGSRVRDAHFLPFLGQIDWVNASLKQTRRSSRS